MASKKVQLPDLVVYRPKLEEYRRIQKHSKDKKQLVFTEARESYLEFIHDS